MNERGKNNSEKHRVWCVGISTNTILSTFFFKSMHTKIAMTGTLLYSIPVSVESKMRLMKIRNIRFLEWM